MFNFRIKNMTLRSYFVFVLFSVALFLLKYFLYGVRVKYYVSYCFVLYISMALELFSDFSSTY